MIFGASTFGIEIGEILAKGLPQDALVQFRFLIGGKKFGDWEDRVLLLGSIRYMKTFVDCKKKRMRIDLAKVTSAKVFESTYDAFYHYDYRSVPAPQPNFRDRYHLDDIGLGAIVDRFGIVVVDISESNSRILVKDLRNSEIIVDVQVVSNEIENACREYLAWGKLQISHS